MKTRIATLVLFVIMVLSVPAYAMSPWAYSVRPSLSFSGTTAICAVTIVGEDANDDISATIKLWDGSTCIKTWNVSGTYYLRTEKTALVTKGESYTLTVDATIDGEVQPQMSTSGTCR